MVPDEIMNLFLHRHVQVPCPLESGSGGVLIRNTDDVDIGNLMEEVQKRGPASSCANDGNPCAVGFHA